MVDGLQDTGHKRPEGHLTDWRWRLVYAAVIAFAALSILSLYLFSQYFSG